jgi:hypothetical protein
MECGSEAGIHQTLQGEEFGGGKGHRVTGGIEGGEAEGQNDTQAEGEGRL